MPQLEQYPHDKWTVMGGRNSDSSAAPCSREITVELALLEMLTQIACDYINPNGQAHHGVPPVSQAAAHRAIKEAGKILDATS